jgi:hypothetical protein
MARFLMSEPKNGSRVTGAEPQRNGEIERLENGFEHQFGPSHFAISLFRYLRLNSPQDLNKVPFRFYNVGYEI